MFPQNYNEDQPIKMFRTSDLIEERKPIIPKRLNVDESGFVDAVQGVVVPEVLFEPVEMVSCQYC